MNILKSLLLSCLSLNVAMAGGLIQEEVYVTSNTKDIVKLIAANPELTMDHMHQDGFELYGPKGMKKWLDQVGIEYMEQHAHQKDRETDLNALDYPDYKTVVKNLRDAVALNPKIAKMFSIGKSVDGKDLWVVKISDNVEIDEVEPEFKYISSMHGDEITGRELMQFLVKDIIAGYGSDKRITELVNNTEIYIMASMNPDGSKRRQRANANGYDLNRNFPDWSRGDVNSTSTRQPETVAVMNFQASRQFALSANFHGGAVVVNYPWDCTSTRHPFDKLVREISVKYALENPEMKNSRRFRDGVTNGADWYVLNGGMQDWSYHWYNDLQVTVELSQSKWPRYSEIPNYYKNNQESLLVYLDSIHQGAGFKLAGLKKSGKVKIVKLNSDGTTEDKGSFGFSNSEFYKVLPLGEYEFYVDINGESSVKTFRAFVEDKINANGNYTTI